MNAKRILLIQGHPDTRASHLCHALLDAYADGAVQAGNAVRRIGVADLDFPLLRNQADWERGKLPASLQQAQDDIEWSEHIVMFFPLWLGDMPALLKGFLEQVARPGFAFERSEDGAGFGRKRLVGRSARVVVTMGMPAFVYRWYFRAHSLRSLERNILGFVGISPIHATLVGLVGNFKMTDFARWSKRMRHLGAKGS